MRTQLSPRLSRGTYGARRTVWSIHGPVELDCRGALLSGGPGGLRPGC